MKQASGEFAEDPCSSVKRGNMVRAARALLSAVTHLLVLADMADVYRLLMQLKLVRWTCSPLAPLTGHSYNTHTPYTYTPVFHLLTTQLRVLQGLQAGCSC